MTADRRLRALITNDDGFGAAGLHCLARAMAAAGLDCVVAAPIHEASGSSAAIRAVATAGHVAIERRAVADELNVSWFAVDGSPALVALIATRGAFGAVPDVVLSGINRGANTGSAVMHSGTVGAALTAAVAGRHAMAVSLDLRGGHDDPRKRHWSTAARICELLLPQLMRLPAGTILNVNVPDLPLEEVRGIRSARLGGFGRVQITETERGSGLIRIALEDPNDLVPGSDLAYLADDYATVTALQPISEAGLELPMPDWAPDGREGAALVTQDAAPGS